MVITAGSLIHSCPVAPIAPGEETLAAFKQQLARESGVPHTRVKQVEADAYLAMYDGSMEMAVAAFHSDNSWAEQNPMPRPTAAELCVAARPSAKGDGSGLRMRLRRFV